MSIAVQVKPSAQLLCQRVRQQHPWYPLELVSVYMDGRMEGCLYLNISVNHLIKISKLPQFSFASVRQYRASPAAQWLRVGHLQILKFILNVLFLHHVREDHQQVSSRHRRLLDGRETRYSRNCCLINWSSCWRERNSLSVRGRKKTR